MSAEQSRSNFDPDTTRPILEMAEVVESSENPFGRRLMALAEVTLCSGFPTQLGLISLLSLFGYTPSDAAGQLSISYIIVLSFADTIVVLLLVWSLMEAHNERPVATFVGKRPIAKEVALGIGLVPIALIITATVFGIIRQAAPWLHNVPKNPLEALIQSPTTAILFTVVAVIAGGFREEVQRAFILNRFEQHLGGSTIGLVVFSVAFGLGHLVQGQDAALVTGLLGAFWGIVYLKRRSVVAPIFSHAIFNIVEIQIAYRANVG